MQKTALLILAFIALVAMGILFVEIRDTVTGNYVTSGGGDWYYGTQQALLQPDEACIYQGYQPLYPWRVTTNEFGTQVSVCRHNGQYVVSPLVQTIRVR